ncbi:MAG TPA: zinc ribbon domain-containing protein [Thermosulfurimonas dismutans]|uniref:Zinc ribbon domain-containing protein n=1 Tax=Thermosulfurimonas dismutans TaxID=999894 RepID=A0A7C3GDV7_9BACT|nr:zinc ribbon domain-containing protein [Thermosulfurimonas sp.]HFC97058.1 zinc ribbon domain-containing protein [Thermosulfurimonas dismutans]
MPIYEFRCDDCGERFEKLCLSSRDEQETRCPRCGSPRVRREFSTFACSLGGGFGFGSCGTGGHGFGFG